MLVPSFLATTLLALGAEAIAKLNTTEYEQIRAGAKIPWAQGRKVPKYGPGYCTVAVSYRQ